MRLCDKFSQAILDMRLSGKQPPQEIFDAIKKMENDNMALTKALKNYFNDDGGSFDAPSWIGEQAIKALGGE